MNLPNKLTLLRIVLIPLFVVIFYIPYFMETEWTVLHYTFPLGNLVALIIFAIAAYTDRLDGKIARKYNLVTTFGKFMDPLADKLLVTAALLVAIELRMLPAYVPIIIISRELMVTGIRLLAVSEGKVIAASPLGKAKTVTQIVLILALLVFNPVNHVLFSTFAWNMVVVDVLILLATLATLVSGIDYFIKNKHIILQSK